MEISVILLIAVCAVLLARDLNHRDQRLRDMEKRLHDLEAADRKRMPFKSQEELLDAMAAISRYMEERKIQDAFIENAAGHITNAMSIGTVREKK